MKCEYFGLCGSCTIYDLGYEGQLNEKVKRFEKLFGQTPKVFPSPPEHFRARGEFRISDGSYAMHALDKKGLVAIEKCPIMLKPIYELMPKLLEAIKSEEVLAKKLFRIDFLSGLNSQTLASIVYHRALDESWQEAAQVLSKKFGIEIVGRSRGQKVIVGRDYITESLSIKGEIYTYHHYEGSFTQPNPYVNIKMIEWVLDSLGSEEGDLLELYCGAGNFTLPLSRKFRKVLATEVSKSSIRAAQENIELNQMKNIDFVRLSSEEVTQALKKERPFRRLSHIDLDSYDFTTVFVDPPRCGLDDATRDLIAQFPNIIYISCNPETLKRDLEFLEKSHRIEKMALFDQFPYTPHMESGAFLVRR